MSTPNKGVKERKCCEKCIIPLDYKPSQCSNGECECHWIEVERSVSLQNKPTPHEALREEFSEQFGYELGAEGYWVEPDIEEKVVNWWLSKLSQKQSELREKVAKLLVYTPEEVAALNKDLDSRTQQDLYSSAIGFQEAIKSVLSLLDGEDNK